MNTNVISKGLEQIQKDMQRQRTALVKQLFNECLKAHLRQDKLAIEFRINHVNWLEVDIHAKDNEGKTTGEQESLIGVSTDMDMIIEVKIEKLDWMYSTYTEQRFDRQQKVLQQVIKRIKQIK